MTSVTKGYLAGDQFIVDELLRRAARMVAHLPAIWKRDGHIAPVLLLWPAEAVKTREGKELESTLVVGQLPDDRSMWSEYLRQAVELAHAYAVLLIEPTPNRVTAIFESHLGAHAWLSAIEAHGDVKVLKPPQETQDRECLGILWRRDAALN